MCRARMTASRESVDKAGRLELNPKCLVTDKSRSMREKLHFHETGRHGNCIRRGYSFSSSHHESHAGRVAPSKSYHGKTYAKINLNNTIK